MSYPLSPRSIRRIAVATASSVSNRAFSPVRTRSTVPLSRPPVRSAIRTMNECWSGGRFAVSAQ
jgi:hypothetical protein